MIMLLVWICDEVVVSILGPTGGKLILVFFTQHQQQHQAVSVSWMLSRICIFSVDPLSLFLKDLVAEIVLSKLHNNYPKFGFLTVKLKPKVMAPVSFKGLHRCFSKMSLISLFVFFHNRFLVTKTLRTLYFRTMCSIRLSRYKSSRTKECSLSAKQP